MRKVPTILHLVFSFSVVFSGVDLFAQGSVALDLNFPVSRELKSREKHVYSVTATSNEFVEIECERKGTDVALTAIGPAGEKLSVSNAPEGFAGFDRLVFVADKAGAYRIEVSSRRPGNVFGTYSITLKNRRTATDVDLTRAAAMKLLGEARETLQGAENRYEKATRAVEKLERAVMLFERSDDLQGRANALFHIGKITGHEFGDEPKAVENFEKALEIWRKIDDEAGRAICLIYAARELSDKGNFEESLAYFNEAQAINRKLGDRLGEAVTLSFLCRSYNNTGRFQKGFETCRESLRLGQDADPMTDYYTYSALGALYGNTKDTERALEYCQIALDRVLLTGDQLNPIRRATLKANIGGILFEQKKYSEARPSYEVALAVSQAVKRPKYEAYFLNRLSLIFFELKQFEKALEYGERSLLLYRQHYPRNRQATLNLVSQIYTALGQNEKARGALFESLEINRQNRDRYAEAETLYNLAELEKRIANLGAAQIHIREAIKLSEILRADLLGRNQRSTYLSILKRYYELDIDLLAKLYEGSRDVSYLEQAWQNQEKVRARSLLENSIETGYGSNDREVNNFFAQEHLLLEKIAEAERNRADSVKAKADEAEAVKNLNKALDEYHVLQEENRSKNPRFSAVGLPQQFAFSDVQNLLDSETFVLEFALGERQSYAWLIGKGTVKFVKLPAKNIINRTAREFYGVLAEQNANSETAQVEKSRQLSRVILQPLAKELDGVKRLIVVADGSLQLIPFSALPLALDKTFEPLSARMEIVNAPSASSLVYLNKNKTNRQNIPDKFLAIFADPIFNNDDERIVKIAQKAEPISGEGSGKLSQTLSDFGVARLARLPFSGVEAREIAKFSEQKAILILGADASRQKFLRGDFSSYRILHFATHGFLNQTNPDLSGLVLSLYDENRRPQNGFLRLIDLYSLNLNAELVVLSACQTALGKEVDGEGVVGLTRGFLYAGASRVISSMWKVEDAATAELMKRFYRAMLKENQTPSAALRIAQNEMRQIPRFSNPRFWAGFTLTGEWK